MKKKKLEIVLFVLSIIVAGSIIYLFISETNKSKSNPILSLKRIFASQKISENSLKESTSKFSTTISNLQSARNEIKQKGYNLHDEMIDYEILKTLCLGLSTNDQSTQSQPKANCLNFKLLSTNKEEIDRTSDDIKQKWAQVIYHSEYNQLEKGFTLDGVIDENDKKILEDQVSTNLAKDFKGKTQLAFSQLVREIQNEDPLLQENLIYKALTKILKDAPAQEESFLTAKTQGKSEKEKLKEQAEWIDGIYQLQRNQNLPLSKIDYGVIGRQFDPTYTSLKNAIIDELGVPRSILVPARSQFEQTKQGINQIIRSIHDDLVKDPKLEKSLEKRYPGIIEEQSLGIVPLNLQLEEDIKAKIQEILGVKESSLDFDFLPTVDESNSTKRDKWITAIYRYQKYKLGNKNPEGTLSASGVTGKTIINNIKQQFKDELQYY